MGLSTLLGSILCIHTSAAQSSPQQSSPLVTVAPGTPPQGAGNIDYKNAQPMPLPSLPGPPSGILPPTTLSPGGVTESPEPSPGSIGTGKTSPQILIPPQPLPEPQPPNNARTTGRKRKARRVNP